MMTLCCDVLAALKGKTLATAESCTGGGIGAAITAVPGSSEVFKGGIISYTNWVKNRILGVDQNILDRFGAVSAPVAESMAQGARAVLETDVAVSVTGLAGPGADEFGNPVGLVFIGYSDKNQTISKKFLFPGDRETVRQGAVTEALKLVLENNKR